MSENIHLKRCKRAINDYQEYSDSIHPRYRTQKNMMVKATVEALKAAMSLKDHSFVDWIDSISCPYCGSDRAEWRKEDACVACPDCGEADCI